VFFTLYLSAISLHLSPINALSRHLLKTILHFTIQFHVVFVHWWACAQD
jgi:hypothetical protein